MTGGGEDVLAVGPAPGSSTAPPRPFPLLRAAHLGPTLAVTTLTALLAVAERLPPYDAVLVTAAVLTGQLTIGWGNDLVDATRDRIVGRPDKPLATGEVTAATLWRSLLIAAAACVLLSALLGWRSGGLHLVLVAMGHAYNLGLKSTCWSWLPYAVAFGVLPAVVALAATPAHWPPLWIMSTAALLGVAAHLLNTLPDQDDDLATGVSGLPHRLGAGTSRGAATALVLLASTTAVLGPTGAPTAVAWAALVMVVALAVVALLGRGRVPFHAAIAIALVDVVLLTVVSR